MVLVGVALSSVMGVSRGASAGAAGDSQGWLRHLMPLPKEVTFEGTVALAPTEVAIRIVPSAGDLGEPAGRLLRQALRRTSEPGTPRFTIRLGLCDKGGNIAGVAVGGAEKLGALPNCEQAYVIAPVENGLTVAALDDRGLYYGAVTLAQLLPVKFTPERVTLPLVRVLDWPDLSERGGWGGNMGADFEWMSSVKLNLAEVHATLGFAADGSARATFDPDRVEQARQHAFHMVPIIHHIDQLAPKGLFSRHPETRGVGPTARLQGHDYCEVPCSSSPSYQAIMAKWMTDLTQIEGVDTLCVWLSENDLQCGCEPCKAVGEFAAETRLCLKAWQAARQVNPTLKLRLLLTQGSYKTNDKVLAEVPPGVQVSYYDGGRTYDSSREPMIYPLLEDYAKSGRWLGVYPQITPSWRIVCPWSGPQFIKARMTEFVDKRLSNLCAYATPNNRLYDFNVSAAAEWSWNAHGRDEWEFAAAWAARRGVKEVEKAADWAVSLGEVGWDLYGSRIPYTAFFGSVGRAVRDRAKPVLGKGYYRYFPTEQALHQAVTTCERATQLAAELGDPWISAETQVIAGYVTMMERLYGILTLVSRKTPPTEAERESLNRDLMGFAQAGVQVNEGLKAWGAASLDTKIGGRLSDTIEITDQTVIQVSQALLPFGVRNPLAPYLVREIGQYHDQDFEEKQAIQRRIEASDCICAPGTYQVKFTHTKGWNALTVQRVALASSPRDRPEQLSEIVFDRHPGTIGYTPKAPLYTLVLPTYDEELRYWLVMDITGVKSSVRPQERRGCNGSITVWKTRDPDLVVQPLPLLPMSVSEKARYGGPKFTSGGLPVGVIQGGYGSTSMLAVLQDKPGLDVQPVWLVNAEDLRDCKVLILPQPSQAETFSPDVAAVLTAFVKDGGGLLSSHNSVGFKGLPVILPEVCARGVVNRRDGRFKASAEHPITKGLPLGKALQASYYDYITIEPGPAGTVVCRGFASAEPMVVCGAVGKGRYVACGLAPGIRPSDDTDCTPTPDEALLLENAVRWAGEKH